MTSTQEKLAQRCYLAGLEAQQHLYCSVRKTKLEEAECLSDETGSLIYLKREDQQPIFSFKIRGSYNKIRQLSPEQVSAGIVACSAGNHAQGVSLACQKIGVVPLIIMPLHTNGLKIKQVERYGGKIMLHGDTYQEAYQKALEMVESDGLTLVHPYDDLDVIAGNATIGLEIFQQFKSHVGCDDTIAIDYIFVCIGGGGLISGIASAFQALSPGTRVIGVETYGANCMTQSLEAGEIVELDSIDTFVEGKAVSRPGELTFQICQKYVSEIVNVSNSEVAEAVRAVYHENRSVVEPAGAVSVAGMLKYMDQHRNDFRIGERRKRIVCVISGANLEFGAIGSVLQQFT